MLNNLNVEALIPVPLDVRGQRLQFMMLSVERLVIPSLAEHHTLSFIGVELIFDRVLDQEETSCLTDKSFFRLRDVGLEYPCLLLRFSRPSQCWHQQLLSFGRPKTEIVAKWF